MSAPLVPGQTVLLDVDDSPYGTWRRGDRAEVLRADGRYWEVRIERNRVALTFDRRELVAETGTDAGTASTAVTVGALVFLGLWLVVSGWLLHVHDQHCHTRAATSAAHSLCEEINR